MSATVPPGAGRAASSSKRRAKSKRPASPIKSAARLKPSRKKRASAPNRELVAVGRAKSNRKRSRAAVQVIVAEPRNNPARVAVPRVEMAAISPTPVLPTPRATKSRTVSRSVPLATITPSRPPVRAKILDDWRLTGLESIDYPRLTAANTGDHQAIYQFLLATFQSPTYEAFLNALDEPLYEPTDRLLVKRGDQVLAHLRLARRVMQLGPLAVPVAEVVAMAVLPEFRGLGFGRTLLGAINRSLAEDGTLIATLRTGIPQFFGSVGWSVCGRHSWSRADAREVLAQFRPHAEGEVAPRYTIRPWRQVEMPALVRLYREQIARGAGGWQRTEATWRWLLGSNGGDQVFVAIDGPDRLELDEANASIVGYLVLRDDAIVELVAAEDHLEAARQLLVRACGEGIERNHHQAMTLHAPPDHVAHDWFERVGGVRQHRATDQGQVRMAKLLDPVRCLQLLAPLLHERAEAASLDRPTELGLLVGREKYRLIASRRSVKLGSSQIGRSYLSLGRADFTRLLLGHLDVDEAIDAGQIAASTRTARETAQALFPRLPLWRSPLDEPAC